METIEFTQSQRMLGSLTEAADRARASLGVLDDKLLTLRLNFGKLRAAMERAFAPLTAAAAPVVNSAIRALTDFCDDAGAVMAALFGTVQKKAVTTTKASGAAVRRSLADFDQIQRLNGGSGGSGSTTTVTFADINDPLTPRLQQIVDKIHRILAPLQRIDLSPLKTALTGLAQALTGLGAAVGQQLLTAWERFLAPLAKWTVETAAPASVQALTAAFTLLQAVFAPVGEGITALLTQLQPVTDFLASVAVRAVQTLQTRFTQFAAAITAVAPNITEIFRNLGQLGASLATLAAPALTALQQLWQGTSDYLKNILTNAVTAGITVLEGLTGFLSGRFSGSWKTCWEGLKTVARGAVNGIIGTVNALLLGITAGINTVIKGLNALKIDIPAWVPVFGGERIGFSLRTVSAPQIPYLAQGAVLPANKPFLAVVGDQRSGTNIEAPLATIREAVALELQRSAGHGSTDALLREILQAILGIRIGDEQLSAACDRYNARLAVMKGV